MVCPNCGAETSGANANFCYKCAIKLKEVCDCWVMDGPYNCGKEKCPGIWLKYDLLLNDITD